MRLYFCGTRGSTPAPGPDFIRYGGHTSCVAGARDEDAVPTLILDAGTGLRQATPLLAGRPFAGTILLTHPHWNHVHGLPFFGAGDTEGATATLLLPEQEDGACAKAVLERGMSPPHFPIRPRDLRGAWTFGTLAPGHYATGGSEIEAREIPHKGGPHSATGSATADRSSAAFPTIARPCSGRALTAGGSITTPPPRWPRMRTSSCTTRPCCLKSCRRRHRSATPQPTTRSAWPWRPEPGGRAVPSPPGHRVDDELDQLGRRLSGAAVPVTVAAEKGILGL